MYHILVAEDERIERMALVKVLSDALGEGYAIHEAENGRQAVELFRQHPIGVAILDIEMPVMSGIDTAQIWLGRSWLPAGEGTSSTTSRRVTGVTPLRTSSSISWSMRPALTVRLVTDASSPSAPTTLTP